MKISLKPNNAKKRPEKGQTDKARIKAKLYLRYCHSFCHKKYLNYKDIKKIFFKIKIKSCLALYWDTDLPLHFTVCEIAQFG